MKPALSYVFAGVIFVIAVYMLYRTGVSFRLRIASAGTAALKRTTAAVPDWQLGGRWIKGSAWLISRPVSTLAWLIQVNVLPHGLWRDTQMQRQGGCHEAS